MQYSPISLDHSRLLVQVLLSGDTTRALEVLIECEKRHGVEVLKDTCQDSCGVSDHQIPKREPLHYKGLLQALHSEDVFGSYYDFEMKEPPLDALFAFITETQMILLAEEFANDYFIRYADGSLAGWGWRCWGGVMADWANSTGWGPCLDRLGKPRPWTYVDFYMTRSAGVLVVDYRDWAERFLGLVDLKCERLLREA